MVARVSTMKLVGLPGTNNGSSGCSGMNTVPEPPLVTRSRPWSKNWPKKVIHWLKGAVRPASGLTFGSKKVSNVEPSVRVPVTTCAPALRTSSTVPRMPSRPGSKVAATAAGLLAVWSTIRLLMVRGCESITRPLVWV
ncbi:hypothetical protein D3C81_939460 [compost metagenome]